MKLIYDFRKDRYKKVVADGIVKRITEQQAKVLMAAGAILVQR